MSVEFDLSSSHNYMLTMGYRQLLVFVKSLSTCDQSLIEIELKRPGEITMLCYRPYIHVHVGELHGCSGNSIIYNIIFCGLYG